MNDAIGCHSCSAAEINEIPEFRSLARVSSDCHGRSPGGRLAVCSRCGLVQAMVGPAWREEIDEIYRNYDIYFQSGGIEQAVFNSQSGASSTRSARLVQGLSEYLDLPENGRMLDVGCGNGAFIRAFASEHSSWELCGSEISDKYQQDVEAIQGVRQFFAGGIDGIKEKFELLSLIHVLEHIESPIEFLTSLRDLIMPDGNIFVEVPYFLDNPFDLIIADHASHFTPSSLTAIAGASGLKIEVLATDWVQKEISCLLSRAKTEDNKLVGGVEDSLHEAKTRVKWLENCRESLKRPGDAPHFGIFGTSIGANWLHEELKTAGNGVDFFVDEDPNRIGHRLLDRPIYSPPEIPADSVVAVPLAPVAAANVAARLHKSAAGLKVLVAAEVNP